MINWAVSFFPNFFKYNALKLEDWMWFLTQFQSRFKDEKKKIKVSNELSMHFSFQENFRKKKLHKLPCTKNRKERQGLGFFSFKRKMRGKGKQKGKHINTEHLDCLKNPSVIGCFHQVSSFPFTIRHPRVLSGKRNHVHLCASNRLWTGISNGSAF